MPQSYLRPENLQGSHFFLDPKESHHVIHVLRKKTGDQIDLFDGQGRRFVGEILTVDQKAHSLKGRILETIHIAPRAKITLYQGLPKGSKFDFVIEKAAELGVDRIQPIASEKNPIGERGSAGKRERWNRLAQAASKQCGRSTLPIINDLRALSSLGEELTAGFSILFAVDGQTERLSSCLAGFNKEAHANLNLIVGPESGFSDKELVWMKSIGCHCVSLGRLTLRTETAGLVGLSLVSHELDWL